MLYKREKKEPDELPFDVQQRDDEYIKMSRAELLDELKKINDKLDNLIKKDVAVHDIIEKK